MWIFSRVDFFRDRLFTRGRTFLGVELFPEPLAITIHKKSYLGRGGGVILNLLIGELGVVTTKSSSELQEFTEAFNAAAA